MFTTGDTDAKHRGEMSPDGKEKVLSGDRKCGGRALNCYLGL